MGSISGWIVRIEKKTRIISARDHKCIIGLGRNILSHLRRNIDAPLCINGVREGTLE